MEEKRTKLQVGSLLATGVLFVIFLGVYLFQFTRPGIVLQGQFFVSQSATRYTGTLEGWRGEVTVTPQENGAICSLDFPGLAESYTFTFGESAPGDVRDVTITGGDGALVLECFYAGPGLPLLDGTGAPATDDGLTITAETAGESQTTLFSTPFTSLAQLAAGDNIHYRGSWQWFFFISVLAGLLSLTVAFPMAWFKLNHFLSVRDPEPSDFYLAMMKVEWVLVPVLLLIGYLWGLTLYT